MFVHLAFLLILLLRPSWGLWGFFSVAVVARIVIGGLTQGLDAVTTAIAAGIEGVIFCALGALVVWLRLKFKKGGTKQEKEIDAELARIRAEAASRENPPPAAQ